jgi:glutathione-specific gamma-glutamylcyclotransferase
MRRALGDPLPDPMPAEIAALRRGDEPVWIFAYGSLMWDVEIPRAEAEPALLRGYHRSFCLYSYDYRGSRARPGLTLGLDRGGACRGMALRLPPASLAEAIDRLWWREMTAPRVYDMRLLTVRTGYGARRAFAFTVRRDHPDYAGRLPLDEAARLIAGAAGRRGACRDYLADTVHRLEQLGLADAPLRRLAERVAALGAPHPPAPSFG